MMMDVRPAVPLFARSRLTELRTVRARVHRLKRDRDARGPLPVFHAVCQQLRPDSGITDGIGRIYRSTEKDMRDALRNLKMLHGVGAE